MVEDWLQKSQESARLGFEHCVGGSTQCDASWQDVLTPQSSKTYLDAFDHFYCHVNHIICFFICLMLVSCGRP
jgi:hypothetical protein